MTCFTVTIPGQPGAPQLITSTSSSIEIKWSPAYDDGGSPIVSYSVEMDQVEGIGLANIENWINVFTGAQLTATVTDLTATEQYRFRIRSITEYAKMSLYSETATFYAASQPEQV